MKHGQDTMSSYGSASGLAHIQLSIENHQDADPGVAPYHVQRDEPSQTIMQQPHQVGFPQRHRRIKSHSTMSTMEHFNRWTRKLIPHWVVISSQAIESRANEIQYSVFKSIPGYEPVKTVPIEGFGNSGPISRVTFESLVDRIIDTIALGTCLPQRIAAGSSGSYFVFNEEGEIVGVFKPKDEEPYGPLSPKWSKFIHRNLFPCFFGRSCLIPNLGYICESAASLLDRQLQTFIVPFTDTVYLSSPTFYYPLYDKLAQKFMKRELPKKVGSLQMFLIGYMQADEFLKKYPLPGTQPWKHFLGSGKPTGRQDKRKFEWSEETVKQFVQELEKLVILDYIMRNTDRGLDNWMIKIEWIKKYDHLTGISSEKPFIKIGAIDSGLSWPWKHPDEWRSFPFGWLFLPLSIIGQPFSDATRNHFLPLLTSTAWWEESCVLFREMFSRDTEFKERMWRKQWAVMKGQAFNVVETLKCPGQGPLELVRRTRVTIWDEEMDVPYVMPVSVMAHAMETPIWDNSSPDTLDGRKHVDPRDKTSFDTIEEGQEDLEECQVVATSPSNFEGVGTGSHGSHQYGWSQLVKGNIDEQKFYQLSQESPAKTDSKSGGLESTPLLAGSDLEHAHEQSGINDVAQGLTAPIATKRVIIERLQTVNSKPPVFTWC